MERKTGARIGYFFAAFLPLLGMFAINILVTIPITIVKTTSLMRENPSADYEFLMNEIMNMTMDSDFQLSVTIIFQIVFILAGAAIYYFGFKEKKIENPLTACPRWSMPEIICLFIGVCFIVLIVMGVLSSIKPEWFEAYNELIEQSGIGEMSALSTLATLILAPIGEEICFRGMTFKLSRKFTRKFWVANCLQALMFGIAHLNLVQGLYAFFMGIVLGWIYRKFNSLWATMLAHLSFNFSGTYLSSWILGDSEETSLLVLAVALISLGLFVSMIILINKNEGAKEREALFMAKYANE